MREKLFYFDPASGTQATFARWEADAAKVPKVPAVFQPTDTYHLFVMLRAAMQRHAQVALVGEGVAADVLAELTADLTSKAASEGHLSEGVGAQGVSENTRPVDPQARFASQSESKPYCQIGVFTSGTSGRPKLIWHGLDSLRRSVQVSEKHADDVWGFAYNPTHFAGLQVFFQAIANRNSIVRLFGLSPSAMHHAIDNGHITHISATPTFFRMLCGDGVVHSQVRAVTLGGERLGESLRGSLQETFPQARIRNVYASTEAGTVLVADGELFSVPPQYVDQVRVVDGELQIHQSLLAESLRDGRVDAFFSTGDLVELVSENPLRFRFFSRRSDWINVGGYKVNPQRVEELLTGFEEVAEVRVFGKANSVIGNIVCCDIQLRQGHVLEEATVKQRLAGQLAKHEVPQIIQFVEGIAKTSTGKKQR